MKINFLKNLAARNRARCGLALLVSLTSIWFALVPGAAQSKSQKRVTSLQISEGREGALVTIVSDSLLNDYEAFRRGDRFYVRIPLADFTSGKPGFHGDGFDDVQVQEIGDSVVVSFKLQPGASARVDQHSNRLEVIFSAPNRMARTNRTNVAPNRDASVPSDGIVRVNNPQTKRLRQRDAAGPMPPDSPTATRERLANERASDFSATRNQPVKPAFRDEFSRRGSSRSAGNIGSSPSTFGASSPAGKAGSSPASSAASQPSGFSKAGSSPAVSKYEPSPVATPSSSPSYPAFASSTPAAPVASQPAAKSPGLNGAENWKTRSDIALQWIKANRQASLVGGLLALLLLVFIAALLIRRRKNLDKAKRTEKALAQPKESAAAAASTRLADAPVVSPTSNMVSKDVVNENAARTSASELNQMIVPVAPANGARTNGSLENAQRVRMVPEQAVAQSVATAPNHAWVPVTPSQDSSADEDPEREVFEL